MRHEAAVGVAVEVDRPEVLDCHCFCYELGQIGDIILAGLAAIAAVVGWVPELITRAVEGAVWQQEGESLGVDALVEGGSRRRGRRSFLCSREERR